MSKRIKRTLDVFSVYMLLLEDLQISRRIDWNIYDMARLNDCLREDVNGE